MKICLVYLITLLLGIDVHILLSKAAVPQYIMLQGWVRDFRFEKKN